MERRKEKKEKVEETERFIVNNQDKMQQRDIDKTLCFLAHKSRSVLASFSIFFFGFLLHIFTVFTLPAHHCSVSVGFVNKQLFANSHNNFIR